MAQLTKIDSNVTGLRYAAEASFKTLPGSPVWVPLEPNSYQDFGGQVTSVARNPINATRQRKKGVAVDLDASGGFEQDLTQSNAQELMEGFMFAARRTKTEFGGASEITNVDGTAEEYDAASGLDAFAVGDLVFAAGFTNSANNGLKRVTGAAATALTVAEDLVDETPPAAATLVQVGVQSAAGDLDVDASGSLPALTSTTLDFTTLDLVVGEWIFIGGDTGGAAGDQFLTAANNGFKRIRSIAANSMTFDKSEAAMVTEANTAETVRLFFGRVLKNESDTSLIARTTYQLERQLGAPDDASPSDIQAEYLEGCVANEFAFQVNTADKLVTNLSFVAADSSTIDGPTSLKSGTRPSLVEADAFNTSSNIPRINMHIVEDGNESPTPLFAFVTDLSVTINNNASPNKAVGTFGAFEVTAGTFAVSGEVTAYFSNVSGISAVRNNSDVSLDFHMVANNAGISLDLPLLSLGDGRPNVEQDEPITLPITMDAATGAKIDTNLDHTLLLVFWDYLPTAAAS